MSIGRNDPCPCGSNLKYKKCCLDKIENQEAITRKLLQDDFEKWMIEDEKLGIKYMQEATHNPPDDPEGCPECPQTDCAFCEHE